MSSSGPLLRDVSDTARWAAVFRARETDRSHALFRDPFARRLAGERGAQILAEMPNAGRNAWSWVARTYLFDCVIGDEVTRGADVVLNLAAGLDARPYRMQLPPTLRWIEVDLPGLIAYKAEVLGDAKPVCALERVSMDLSDEEALRILLAEIGRTARRVLVITEGLLIYLTPAQVAALATDLASTPGVRRWVLDLSSPGLLKMMMKQLGSTLRAAGAPLRFAPAEGPPFFTRFGWRVAEVRSLLRTAHRKRRLPFWMRLFAYIPESSGSQGTRPWAAVCLLARD